MNYNESNPIRHNSIMSRRSFLQTLGFALAGGTLAYLGSTSIAAGRPAEAAPAAELPTETAIFGDSLISLEILRANPQEIGVAAPLIDSAGVFHGIAAMPYLTPPMERNFDGSGPTMPYISSFTANGMTEFQPMINEPLDMMPQSIAVPSTGEVVIGGRREWVGKMYSINNGQVNEIQLPNDAIGVVEMLPVPDSLGNPTKYTMNIIPVTDGFTFGTYNSETGELKHTPPNPEFRANYFQVSEIQDNKVNCFQLTTDDYSSLVVTRIDVTTGTDQEYKLPLPGKFQNDLFYWHDGDQRFITYSDNYYNKIYTAQLKGDPANLQIADVYCSSSYEGIQLPENSAGFSKLFYVSGTRIRKAGDGYMILTVGHGYRGNDMQEPFIGVGYNSQPQVDFSSMQYYATNPDWMINGDEDPPGSQKNGTYIVDMPDGRSIVLSNITPYGLASLIIPTSDEVSTQQNNVVVYPNNGLGKLPAPVVTSTPTYTATPEPTQTPTPTVTPENTVIVQPTLTVTNPEPTVAPHPTSTPTPIMQTKYSLHMPIITNAH